MFYTKYMYSIHEYTSGIFNCASIKRNVTFPCNLFTYCIVWQENKSHYRTLTKTRKYLVDGVVVTTTTQKVVAAGEENKSKEDFEMR